MRSIYLIFLFILATWLSLEYLAIDHNPKWSLLLHLQQSGVLTKKFIVSTQPGRRVSLWLGWIGIGAMVIMNGYSARKRLAFMQDWGRLKDWLDFHIFCGLLGPLCILFHCDFKVRGLVAISFWSMVVSFTSGIVGRYLFVQLGRSKADCEQQADQWWKKFERLKEQVGIIVHEAELEELQSEILVYVGAGGVALEQSPFDVFFQMLRGDLRLIFLGPPRTLAGLPDHSRLILKQFGVLKRRSTLLEPLRTLMGYWHTFHTPFAFFMYLVAVVHIVTAMLLGV
jgi:hypothetical protein